MAETEKNLSSSPDSASAQRTRPRWGTSHGLNNLAMIVRDLGQLEDARPRRGLRRAAAGRLRPAACTARASRRLARCRPLSHVSLPSDTGRRRLLVLLRPYARPSGTLSFAPRLNARARQVTDLVAGGDMACEEGGIVVDEAEQGRASGVLP